MLIDPYDKNTENAVNNIENYKRRNQRRVLENNLVGSQGNIRYTTPTRPEGQNYAFPRSNFLLTEN